MGDGEMLSGASDSDRLIGELFRLQVRYPKLIHHLSRSKESIFIWYFIEDLAMECVRVLCAEGLQAEHHFGEARAVQLPVTPFMSDEDQRILIRMLENYLERCASGNL